MFSWVIEKKLARGARPRSGKKWARQVPQSAVDKRIRKAKREYGIRSIICLLDQNSLRFYEQLPAGLLDYYRASGLNVEHIPVRLDSLPTVGHSRKRGKSWCREGELNPQGTKYRRILSSLRSFLNVVFFCTCNSLQDSSVAFGDVRICLVTFG